MLSRSAKAVTSPNVCTSTAEASSGAVTTTGAADSASSAPMSSPAHKKASGLVHFAAGGFGGTLGAVVTCPLEVVKTRLQSSQYAAELRQVQNSAQVAAARRAGLVLEPHRGTAAPSSIVAVLNRQFGAVPALIQNIYRQEGLLALWRGIGPNLAGIVPSRAIYFFSYNTGKETLISFQGVENWRTHMLAAAGATITVATTTAPIWMVKTRMQLQTANAGAAGQFPKYRNSLHCLAEIVRHEGPGALYRGLSASYLGGVETAIQFVLYEHLKTMRRPREPQPGTTGGHSSWLDLLGMAGVAKLVASALTYPHEVIRTRLREPADHTGQRKYTGIRQAVLRILQEEGAGALYGGLGAHLMRVVPNAAIMFLGYEAVVHYFA